METKNKRIILIAVISILVAGNIILGLQYVLAYKQIQETQEEIKTQQLNARIISFLQLFIRDVLKTENEISFEKRLKLENAVRDLNEKEVLSRWEEFTASKTEAEAQERVKNLLDLLVSKLSY
ncbi:MAG: hypothetical protein CEN87_755 [Parcubacteria group bacterium Licking1014_1]|nr:MAG: hypothetical protein CEN87_755 [Parcubacteria group bacterium Licking1014_1]